LAGQEIQVKSSSKLGPRDAASKKLVVDNASAPPLRALPHQDRRKFACSANHALHQNPVPGRGMALVLNATIILSAFQLNSHFAIFHVSFIF